MFGKIEAPAIGVDSDNRFTAEVDGVDVPAEVNGEYVVRRDDAPFDGGVIRRDGKGKPTSVVFDPEIS